MRNSRSRCLRLRVYRLGENAVSHSDAPRLPVLGPGTALVLVNTLAVGRWTIPSLCSNDPALPKSSLVVTSVCTRIGDLCIDRRCAYAVRQVRLTCAAIYYVESSCTPRSRMLVDAMMLHPHTPIQYLLRVLSGLWATSEAKCLLNVIFGYFNHIAALIMAQLYGHYMIEVLTIFA